MRLLNLTLLGTVLRHSNYLQLFIPHVKIEKKKKKKTKCPFHRENIAGIMVSAI